MPLKIENEEKCYVKWSANCIINKIGISGTMYTCCSACIL